MRQEVRSGAAGNIAFCDTLRRHEYTFAHVRGRTGKTDGGSADLTAINVQLRSARAAVLPVRTPRGGRGFDGTWISAGYKKDVKLWADVVSETWKARGTGE